VRLATHKDFADFVKNNGVDFFPLAGDPKELMAFMVRHPGKARIVLYSRKSSTLVD